MVQTRTNKIALQQVSPSSQIDSAILHALRENARMPFMQIAHSLHLSEGTIRNRVHHLQKKGVIKRFTVEVGSQVSALILVNVSTDVSMRDLTRKMKGFGCIHVFEVAGNADIICFAQMDTLEHINELVDHIRALSGVVKTETIPVLKAWE